jgi:hypothetical protein
MSDAERRATPSTPAELRFDSLFAEYVLGRGELAPVVAAAREAFGPTHKIKLSIGSVPPAAAERLEALRVALARVDAGPG